MKKRAIIYLIICTFFGRYTYSQPGSDASDIIYKSYKMMYYQGEALSALVKLNIEERNSNRYREFSLLRKNFDVIESNSEANEKPFPDQKYYIFFHAPPDVEKMSFLVWKDNAGNEKRWLYLSALGMVKRIVSNDKRKSFAGSDLVYEDISGRQMDMDQYALLSLEGDQFTIKAIPKSDKNIEFDYSIFYINDKNYLINKIEYYKEDEIIKEYVVEKVDIIQSNPTVVEAKMISYDDKSTTKIVFENIRYNFDLDDNIFSERYLKNPPLEYLK